LKEESIRPISIVKKMHKSTMHDVRYLLKKKKFFVKVNCPACNNKNYNQFLKKRKFNYNICTKCKTFFLNPRPSLKILDNFYKQSKVYEYFNNFIFPQTEKIRSQKIFLPRINKIIDLCKKNSIRNPKIMDIGAGFGTFLKLAKKKNYFKSILAVEPSKDGIKSCKKKKINVVEDLLENLNPKKIGTFDVITNFEVIEHLYSPIKFLKKIKKFLTKKGILVITCPNGQGYDIQILKEKSSSIDHEHLNYFNPTSIQALFKRSGYKIVEIFTPGQLDVDIIINKMKNENFKMKNDFIYNYILNNNNEKIKMNFQNFLSENNLSSNMWIVSRPI